MRSPIRIFALIFFAAVTASLAELTLPTVFSDSMVLQRDQTVPVWGKAAPRTKVTVAFAGQKKTATANGKGEWRVELEPLAASSDPRALIVTAHGSGSTLQVSNVLVGDVWLCAGQSNMMVEMKITEDAEADIAAADYPQIRYYKTPYVFSATPKERIDGQWTPCTPETVSAFSGVAYYFGRKLHQELNVPVGLVQAAVGATRIEAWTPPSGFEGIESLAGIRQTIRNHKRNHRDYPTSLYNGMIHAHVPFAIRGAIWYQGETNHKDGLLYVDKTRALLNGWRGLWGYDFPFYFVQIAPYQYGQEDPTILPEFWEAQAEIVKQIPNTGMAVVNDAFTRHNIHPPNKKAPGTRLALLALDNTYGQDIVSTGPTFEKMAIMNDKIIVTFSSADGLTTRDGKPPDRFEIAGEAGVFKSANAKIGGNAVILSATDVPKPMAVRFAWHKLASPNLTNAAGLPAPAFRAEIPRERDAQEMQKLLVRTWTSTHGTTVEAFLVADEGQQIILQSVDGQKIKLSPDLLSREDRAYLDALRE